jgi:hypothetical protein
VVGAAYKGGRDTYNGFRRSTGVFSTARRYRAFVVSVGLYLDTSDIPGAWILRRKDFSVGLT